MGFRSLQRHIRVPVDSAESRGTVIQSTGKLIDDIYEANALRILLYDAVLFRFQITSLSGYFPAKEDL